MIRIIFTTINSQDRGAGYATVEYDSDAKDETVIKTTENNLTELFKSAKRSGETLDSVDLTIDDAIDNPLAFIDYLTLNEEEEIVFDIEYIRDGNRE